MTHAARTSGSPVPATRTQGSVNLIPFVGEQRAQSSGTNANTWHSSPKILWLGCEFLVSLAENRPRYPRPCQYADYKCLILLAKAALLTTTDQAQRLTIFPNTLRPLLLTVRRETCRRRRRRAHSTRTEAGRPVAFCRKQRPALRQTLPLSTTLPPRTPNTIREARREGRRV